MPRSTSITGDAAQVRALLSWARANKHDVTRVQVGSCTIDVAPARPAPVPVSKQPARPDRPAIYAQFGGEAFKAGVEEFGELEPVVARR